MKHVASIDIGGTQTRVAVIDETYKIIFRDQFATNSVDPLNTVEKIKQSLSKQECEIHGIGVSCPGPLDLMKGIVLSPPNLPGWHGFQLKDVFEKELGLLTILENDGNLACLGEATIGRGKGKASVQYLTISTGLGAGFTNRGKIVKGDHGFAQEIANIIMWKNGPSHGTLKPGALEAISSGTGIMSRAYLSGLNANHAGDVNDLALQGNDTAKEIMDDAKHYLANAIAMLIAVNDPSIVILGGSVALKIPCFIEEVRRLVQEKVYDIQRDNVKICKAELGDDSGLIGGAIIIMQALK